MNTKILYLHGLEGHLSDEKRKILEKYANVTSPKLDYRANNEMIQFLVNEYSNKNIDIIIGSSMGGFAGYYVSLIMNKPSLLFNPALPYRTSVKQIIPKTKIIRKKFSHIVIGRQDPIIKAVDNLDFLIKNTSPDDNIRINIINSLEHRIPIEIFKQEVKLFFDKISFP